VISVASASARAYTNSVSEAIYAAMKADDKVVAVTAAMCAGNKLDKVREDFPNRFFDTGICESHAVAFAAGMAKSGSAATRVLSQGGVKIDGVRIEDRFHAIAATQEPFVLQVGKRAS